MEQVLVHPISFDQNKFAELFDPCCVGKDIAICIAVCVRIFIIQGHP